MELFKQEPLCTELKRYVRKPQGRMGIFHPLLHEPFCIPELNHHYNRRFQYNKEALEKALDSQDWEGYVFIHERPYRIEAFVNIMDRLNDESYWRILSATWIDTENYFQFKDVWHSLLSSNRPKREAMMDEDDRKVYDALPDVFTIYRGREPGDPLSRLGKRDIKKFGMSWTLKLEVAQFFAKRFQRYPTNRGITPLIYEAKVERKNIIAYLGGRNEAEVLVFNRFLIDPKVFSTIE